MTLAVRLLGAAVLLLCTAGAMAGPSGMVSSGKNLFIEPVALRGTLGEDQVQVNLRVKADMEDGIEGNYFVFGHSQNILLAGEIEGEELFLEESENGTDVSGQWSGKLAGDVISGEWQSADGAVTKPFRISIVRTAPRKTKALEAGRKVKQ